MPLMPRLNCRFCCANGFWGQSSAAPMHKPHHSNRANYPKTDRLRLRLRSNTLSHASAFQHFGFYPGPALILQPSSFILFPLMPSSVLMMALLQKMTAQRGVRSGGASIPTQKALFKTQRHNHQLRSSEETSF